MTNQSEFDEKMHAEIDDFEVREYLKKAHLKEQRAEKLSRRTLILGLSGLAMTGITGLAYTLKKDAEALDFQRKRMRVADRIEKEFARENYLIGVYDVLPDSGKNVPLVRVEWEGNDKTQAMLFVYADRHSVNFNYFNNLSDSKIKVPQEELPEFTKRIGSPSGIAEKIRKILGE